MTTTTTITDRPDLLTAAFAWACVKSGSKARTEAGRRRAVERWCDVQQAIESWTHADGLAHKGETRTEWLVRTYLAAQYDDAQREMREEFARRARWEAAKKAAARVPDYVRYVVYGADAPESTRRAWKRCAGTWLPATDYRTEPIAQIALSRAPWGRVRKRDRGENSVRAGIRTEDNGKWGWDRVVWHYADYTAITSRDGRRLWVRYPDQSEAEYAVTSGGTCRIEGTIVRRPAATTPPEVRVHHLRRYYTAPLRRFAGITWRWDRDGKVGYYQSAEGEQYHTEPRPTGPARRHYLAAVRAFQARRAEHARTATRLAAEQRLAEHADRMFVAIEDSIAAGNCPAGTRQFAEQLLGELTDGYPAAVRADVILARRNDVFTRRACVQAALAH